MGEARVVLYTNLLVSYLLTQGKTISHIIDLWEQAEIDILMSHNGRVTVILSVMNNLCW